MPVPAPQRAHRLPYVGDALAYLHDPLAFLRSTRDRHGDVVGIALGPLNAVLVSDPALVEDILVTRNKLWQKDALLQTMRPVLGDGLLASEGDFWRRQRRLAQPAFHRDRIASYANIMVAHTQRLVARFRDGEARDIHKDMMHLTLDIVAETLFGTSVGDSAEDVGEALEAVLSVVSDPLELFFPVLRRLPTPSRKRFDRAVARLDAIVYGIIEQRRRQRAVEGTTQGMKQGTKQGVEGAAHDLLSLLLEARDEDGSSMSDKQLRDECMTLFLAGHETTALNLSWTWLLLSEHPGATAKLRRELDETLHGRPPTLSDVPRLRYTAQIIAESLRLYPPAWSLGREARQDVEVGGYLVPKGTQVWFCPWSIQRDPRWFSDPDAFAPERWEGELAKTLPRYAYFPFGGGPRLCIGQAFAQMEAVLLLATLAQSCRVEILPSPAIVPEPSVTLRPKHGMRGLIRLR